MSDRVFVGQQTETLDESPQFAAYSRVVITVGLDDDGNEIIYTAGNTTGRTLELDCPWGTQAMANNILAAIRGKQYRPYEAQNALLDPAAEIGDAVTIGSTYSGIYKIGTTFSRLMATDISAPQDEDIDHEYPFEPKANREILRLAAETKSEFKITATNISAKVSKTGGNSSSFGWSLTDSSWVLTSNNQQILKATAAGIEVTGKITATSGYIGSGANGFTITGNAIYNSTTSLSDTHPGIYIGTDGINLGGGNFTVDVQGNLSANTGTFRGLVMAGQIATDIEGDPHYTPGAGSIGGHQIGTGTIVGSTGSRSNIYGYSVGSGSIAQVINDMVSQGATAYTATSDGATGVITTSNITVGGLVITYSGFYLGPSRKYMTPQAVTIGGQTYHLLGYVG